MKDDKFYIGIPAETYDTLRHDAEHFGVYKGNGSEVNMNRFISLLLQGYYNSYKKEISDTGHRIMEMIDPWINKPKKAEEITERVMKEILLPAVPSRKGKNPVRLSYKPTSETKSIIYEIKANKGSYTEYLCRMFMSYCEKPIHARERFIFLDNANFLKDACKGKRGIAFSLFSKPDIIHYAVAYDFVVGREEMCNYLLCQEYDRDHKRLEAKSYRLCKIKWVAYSEKAGSLDDEVVRYLDLTKKNGPQDAMTDIVDICVQLTPKGQVSYRKIYFAKPKPYKIEMLDDGNALYYFNVSPDLVFRFVIRFKAGEAEIISPPDMRERIHRHYKDSLLLYEKTE